LNTIEDKYVMHSVPSHTPQSDNSSRLIKVQEKVLELAAISLGKNKKELDITEPLYSTQSGFDSFALMEFILRLEEEFKITIPDQDLDPGIFASVQTVSEYILEQEKQNA
jgi:acyl carrier protein